MSNEQAPMDYERVYRYWATRLCPVCSRPFLGINWQGGVCPTGHWYSYTQLRRMMRDGDINLRIEDGKTYLLSGGKSIELFTSVGT